MILWSGRKVWVSVKEGFRSGIVIQKINKDLYSIASDINPSVTWTAKKYCIIPRSKWADFWRGL